MSYFVYEKKKSQPHKEVRSNLALNRKSRLHGVLCFELFVLQKKSFCLAGISNGSSWGSTLFFTY